MAAPKINTRIRIVLDKNLFFMAALFEISDESRPALLFPCEQ
jgi:hypothetical protein